MALVLRNQTQVALILGPNALMKEDIRKRGAFLKNETFGKYQIQSLG